LAATPPCFFYPINDHQARGRLYTPHKGVALESPI
jgi:hypothetical protein